MRKIKPKQISLENFKVDCNYAIQDMVKYFSKSGLNIAEILYSDRDPYLMATSIRATLRRYNWPFVVMKKGQHIYLLRYPSCKKTYDVVINDSEE